ncbi:MAG: hypothetical protein HXX20_13850 [Chloroflexi bacterium]|nr:hypothetical protein [Chloroflexota bacterium]
MSASINLVKPQTRNRQVRLKNNYADRWFYLHLPNLSGLEKILVRHGCEIVEANAELGYIIFIATNRVRMDKDFRDFISAAFCRFLRDEVLWLGLNLNHTKSHQAMRQYANRLYLYWQDCGVFQDFSDRWQSRISPPKTKRKR